MDTVVLKKDLPELHGEIILNHINDNKDFAVIGVNALSASEKVEYCAANKPQK